MEKKKAVSGFFYLIVIFVLIFAYQWFLVLSVGSNVSKVKEESNQTKIDYERVFRKSENEREKLIVENSLLRNDLSAYKKEVGSERKIAYLTFDDGPSVNTKIILDILKKNNIKASFFVNGHESDSAKELYKRIHREGHMIGNHTYSHDYSVIYKSVDNFYADYEKLNKLVVNLTGEEPAFARFPGGSNNQISIQYGGKDMMRKIIDKSNEHGYVFVDWNVDSTDASGNNIDKNVLINEVLKQSKGKQFVNVLMHDSATKKTTAEALPQIISGLKKEGFEFMPISKYSPIFEFVK